MMVGVAALWGFAEATCFFILPDFFLLPAVIARPHRTVHLVLATVIGSLVGLLSLALATQLATAAVHDFIVGLPLTTQPMFDVVAGTVSDPASVLRQPISGVPAKIWTWTAMSENVALLPFFAVLMTARLVRFIAVAVLAMVLEKACGEFLRRHAQVFLAIYSIVFVLGLIGVAELR